MAHHDASQAAPHGAQTQHLIEDHHEQDQQQHEQQQQQDGGRYGEQQHDQQPGEQQLEQQQHGEQRDGVPAQELKLTPTLQNGVEHLQRRSNEITVQIDELTRVGVEFIDRLKKSFLGRMHEARGQIEHFEGDVTEAWGVQSEATLGLQERLQNARQLVAHLEAGFGAR